MAKIIVDDVAYEVDASQNLLQVCLSLGLDIPYFCWHPALGSVGACRQCAIKQFKGDEDRRGRIVMACMTPAEEGTRISIADPEAVRFRASVIEWLMVNHPHDCPVCEEGGECHLQDMTLMTGHTYRRYRFAKRTFRNQYLGPFLNHEMNRCIACYRCVRFYADYAGGRDLQVFAAHDDVYFGRHEPGVLEDPFSGNLAEVCPTGVFTDKIHSQHYVRKWDQQGAPSICVHCGHGCNTLPTERDGLLRRIINRYHHAVNGYFLCDRGRFGHGFVNSDRRIRYAYHRPSAGAELLPIGKEEGAERLAALLLSNRKVIGIGSPRASLEANFALRSMVGPDRFFAGIGSDELNLLARGVRLLRAHGDRIADREQVEAADAVLVLGEDVTNTSPRLALALRQSVRQRGFAIADALGIPRWQDSAVRDAAQQARSPLFVLTVNKTALDDIAAQSIRGAPEDLARLGFAIAHALDPAAPAVERNGGKRGSPAAAIAKALLAAERPLIVTGTGSGSEAILDAADNILHALAHRGRMGRIALVVPECNSMGLALFEPPALEAAFEAITRREATAAIVLENDLYRRAPREAVERFLEEAPHVVVVDHLAHDLASRSALVLPAGTFAEADGTFVSAQGRAQRFFQVYAPESDIQESWRWFQQAMALARYETEGAWDTLDEVTQACASGIAAFARIREAAPAADFRIVGRKVPRQPHRSSGRTAISAHRDVHEKGPPDDPDSALAFSMEGNVSGVPPALLTHYWTPRWNSQQAINAFQREVGGPLKGPAAGVRLISGVGAVQWNRAIPAAFRRRKGQWLTVALWHVFGSEELSNASTAIAERIPAPYVAAHPDDLPERADGDLLLVQFQDRTLTLPLRPEPALPRGVAGLPVGFTHLPWVGLPAWAVLTPVEP